MPPADIQAEIESDYARLLVRGAPLVRDARGLISAPVETYLNGFHSPSMRYAVRQAFQHLEADPTTAKHSRTENALRLARELAVLAESLNQVAAGIRQRASLDSAAYTP
jgi:hypothetical protein